jgi:hypothetical protein
MLTDLVRERRHAVANPAQALAPPAAEADVSATSPPLLQRYGPTDRP